MITSTVERQKYLEERYSKTNKRKILNEVFQEIIEPLVIDMDNHDYADDIEKEQDKKLLDINLEILALLAERESITINILLQMFVEKENLLMVSLTGDEILQAIEVGVQYNLYTIEHTARYTRLRTKYVLGERTQKILDRFKYLPPMLCKPLPVADKYYNRGSGYLTIPADSLVLGSGRAVVDEYDLDESLLNNLNQIAYTLNESVIRAYRNQWDNLDEPKEEESEQQYKQRVKNFNKFEKGCYETFAEMIQYGNQFYLTHKFDSRGRFYCCGYHVNYQGNPYSKAVVELKNQEVITDTVNFF